MARFVNSLPDDLRPTANAMLSESSEAAETRWQALVVGGPSPPSSHDSHPDASVRLFDNEVAEPHDPVSVGPSASSLQRALTRLVDEAGLRDLGGQLLAAGRDSDVRRIRELRSEDTDHTWMESLNPVAGLDL